MRNKASKALLLLAHGAGAGMTHQFMEGLAASLLQHHIATCRFNFPYMERGKKRPDRKAVALETIAQMVRAHEKETLPLAIAGKSFGGRMASHLAATQTIKSNLPLVFFGFPLHAPGRQGTERAAHLIDIPNPMLFIQGTRDALADLTLMTEVVGKLNNAEIEILEGADHSFRFLKKYQTSPTQMYDLLAEKTHEFIFS